MQAETKKLDIKYKGKAIKIAYFSRPGPDKTILYLHGLGCSKRDFLGVLERGELKNHTIVAFDFPGCGATEYSMELVLGMDDLVEITHRVAAGLNLKQSIIIGHSMGGLVGVLYAEKYPQEIKAFINVEGNLSLEDCFFSREVIGHSLEEFEQTIFPSIKQRVKQKNNLGFQNYVKLLEIVNPKAYYDYSPTMTSYSAEGDLMNRFAQLTQPKIFMYGSENSSLSYLPELRKQPFPVIEIPDSNHWPGYDNPDFYYKAIADFIGRI